MNSSDKTFLLDLITKYGVHDFFSTCAEVCSEHAEAMKQDNNVNIFSQEITAEYSYSSEQARKIVDNLNAGKHLQDSDWLDSDEFGSLLYQYRMSGQLSREDIREELISAIRKNFIDTPMSKS